MESIIAKVDNHTEEIMNRLSGDIESAINNSLQNIKDEIESFEDNIDEQSGAINDKLSSLMALKKILENILGRLDKIEENKQKQYNAVNEKLDKIQKCINNVFTHTQIIEEYVKNKCAKIDSIEKIQNDIRNNKSQFNAMKDSIKTIQATLDIIVNQTTPFWKKWSK